MKIVRQGFLCNESEYYQIGFISKNEKHIPVIGYIGQQKIYCAKVTVADGVCKHMVYIKQESLPQEVLDYIESADDIQIKLVQQ